MALFSDAGIQFLFRWIHFLSGITWIGLLYYFNFVQGPFMAEADAATKSGATQKLVPRALWWFRWSAALTFLSGVVVLALRRASWSDPWGLTILTGAAFGTVMLANVWRVIWPNQRIDRQRRRHCGRWPGKSRGGRRGAAGVPRLPHQRRVLVPDAVLHGRGVPFHAPG